MAKAKVYDAKSITVLEGLDGVRAKPGMYIGDADSRGVLHLVKEIVGNSLDESTNGHGDTIAISIQGNQITVFDSGRGIPVGKTKDNPKLDALTAVATKLHAGGKLDAKDGNYATSLGTHGVGLAVVNALSSKLQIWTHRNGKIYSQIFSKGKATSDVQVVPSAPKFNGKKWKLGGSIVQWTPDFSCFEKGTKTDSKMIFQWIRDVSWFVTSPKGKRFLPVTFWTDVNNKVGEIKRADLSAYVRVRLSNLKSSVELMNDTLMMERTLICDFVGAWSTSPDMLFDSACNAVKTVDGGTHNKGALKAMHDCFLKLAKKKQKFSSNDLMAGFIGCFNVRVASPQFDSQAKTRLKSPEAEKIAYDEVTNVVTRWIRKNKASALKIVERAAALSSVAMDAKLAKELAAATKTKKGSKSTLPSKLQIATTKVSEDKELFLTEGDSAGGTARKARDTRYQEVLPLRGKILNVEKASSLRESQPIIEMLQSIGFDAKKIDAPLRVGKIIILADPDPDGFHIASLCLTVLWKIRPSLFSEGRVYSVNAPLYIYSTTSEKFHGTSLKDLMGIVPGKFDSSKVTRLKGWGECEPADLKDIAFDPMKRSLIKINHPGQFSADVAKTMGDDVEYRRNLLGFEG